MGGEETGHDVSLALELPSNVAEVLLFGRLCEEPIQVYDCFFTDLDH